MHAQAITYVLMLQHSRLRTDGMYLMHCSHRCWLVARMCTARRWRPRSPRIRPSVRPLILTLLPDHSFRPARPLALCAPVVRVVHKLQHPNLTDSNKQRMLCVRTVREGQGVMLSVSSLSGVIILCCHAKGARPHTASPRAEPARVAHQIYHHPGKCAGSTLASGIFVPADDQAPQLVLQARRRCSGCPTPSWGS